MDWTQYQDEVDYATYSIEDDRIRIYSGRVSRELFDAFREIGFQRAPRQGCFYQVWTPAREDVALALCGEISDEDSTLSERAEDRGERFATYSDNAASRYKTQHDSADRIAGMIPFGQPVLVGHHSENRHRRDLEKIRNKTAKAYEEYDRSKYWARRAAAALSHAERVFEPAAIARKLKRLEADKRGMERQGRQRWIDHLAGQIEYWTTIYKERAGKDVTEQRAVNKGDWVRNGSYWAQVKRVNRSRINKMITTVTIDHTTGTVPEYMYKKWDMDRCSEILSDIEYHIKFPKEAI